MYNFKKSKCDEGHQRFDHKWFRREGRTLLANIKRRNQEEMEDKDVFLLILLRKFLKLWMKLNNSRKHRKI